MRCVQVRNAPYGLFTRFFIAALLIGAINLAGCLPSPTLAPSIKESATSEPSLTPSPTTTPTQTRTARPTATATREPLPTLPPAEALEKVQELLVTNGGCAFPCWWGITPGKTEVAEALNLIEYLGWTYSEFAQGNNKKFFSSTDLGNNQLMEMAIADKENRVEAISFSNNHSLLASRDQWLSIEKLLLTYGEPDQVWVTINVGGEQSIQFVTQPGMSVYLFYSKPFFMVQYYGFAYRENDSFSICLISQDNQYYFDESFVQGLVVYMGSEGLENSPDGLLSPFGRFNGMVKIEEAFNATIGEFENQIISEKELPCFDTPISTWEKFQFPTLKP